MNTLQTFHNDSFGKLRSFVDEDGNLWFVAADVCAALETRTNDALNGLDDDEKGYDTIVSLGGPQKMAVITEPGLYSLILRSRKPEAKAFKRWICHEVVPSIRKTGQYKNSRAGEFVDLLAYVKTLRQMANRDFYPPRMRAEFLAEAAGLLSGYPPSRFMPPEETFYPLFQ